MQKIKKDSDLANIMNQLSLDKVEVERLNAGLVAGAFDENDIRKCKEYVDAVEEIEKTTEIEMLDTEVGRLNEAFGKEQLKAIDTIWEWVAGINDENDSCSDKVDCAIDRDTKIDKTSKSCIDDIDFVATDMMGETCNNLEDDYLKD